MTRSQGFVISAACTLLVRFTYMFWQTVTAHNVHAAGFVQLMLHEKADLFLENEQTSESKYQDTDSVKTADCFVLRIHTWT